MSEMDPGTTNARLSRLEAKYDELAKQLGSAVATIDRVESNQQHAEELNKLRFTALDTSVGTLSTDLKGFMSRIEGLISGEVRLPQQERIMAEYLAFKDDTETRLDLQDVRNGRIDLIGKVVWGLVGGNIVAIVGFVVWVAQGNKI